MSGLGFVGLPCAESTISFLSPNQKVLSIEKSNTTPGISGAVGNGVLVGEGVGVGVEVSVGLCVRDGLGVQVCHGVEVGTGEIGGIAVSIIFS